MLSLNAWFERSEPYLELRNNYTNRTLLMLSGEVLHEALNDLGYVYHDLLNTQNSSELIRKLLLLSIKDYTNEYAANSNKENKIIAFPKVFKYTSNCLNDKNLKHDGNVIYLKNFH